MSTLDGKVTLITGAAGGIGSAVARAFAAEGARLALLDGNATGLEHLARTLRSQGAVVQTRAADLSREEEVKTGIDAVLAPYQDRVDILVANVGALINKKTEDLTALDWEHAFAINCFSHVWACDGVRPRMQAAGVGCIIFTGSDQATQPDAGLAPYAPAKAALTNYAHILVRELAPTICVHLVAPGITRTALVEQRLMPQLAATFQTDAETAMRLELTRRDVPLARLLEPEEVAQAMLYLAHAGPAATGMTLHLGSNEKSIMA